MTSVEYQSLDKKVDRILDHIESQVERNTETEHRLTKLEAGQHRSTKVATGIAAFGTAFINGAFLWLTNGRG